MRPLRLLIAAATCAALLGVSAMPVLAGIAPAVIYVDDDGLGTATSCDGTDAIPSLINDGLLNVAVGGKVFVCPGTYHELVVINTSGVTLRGVSPWTAKVLPPTGQTDGSDLVTINQPGVTVKWLRLIAQTEAVDCTRIANMIFVHPAATNARLRANHIEAQGPTTLGSCAFSHGIAVNAFGSTVVWNRVTNFTGVGIAINPAAGAVVRGNTVNYRHATYEYSPPIGTGIVLQYATSSTALLGNVVQSLPTAGSSTPLLRDAIYVFQADGSLIRGNRIRHTFNGLSIISSTGMHVHHNRFAHGITQLAVYFSGTTLSDVHDNFARGSNHSIEVQAGSSGNNVHDNNFNGPADPDCVDGVGIGNTWTNNRGTGNPVGICDLPI